MDWEKRGERPTDQWHWDRSKGTEKQKNKIGGGPCGKKLMQHSKNAEIKHFEIEHSNFMLKLNIQILCWNWTFKCMLKLNIQIYVEIEHSNLCWNWTFKSISNLNQVPCYSAALLSPRPVSNIT